MQYFGPKIRFLIWDRDFRQWTVCSPRLCGRFGAFGNIFRLFVPELWPFSWPTSANFGSILPDGNRKLPRKIFPFIWSKIGGNRLVSVSFGRKTQFPRTVLRTPVKVVLRRGCYMMLTHCVFSLKVPCIAGSERGIFPHSGCPIGWQVKKTNKKGWQI